MAGSYRLGKERWGAEQQVVGPHQTAKKSWLGKPGQIDKSAEATKESQVHFWSPGLRLGEG